MLVGTKAPALHLDPKSRFGPCDEARAIAEVIRVARGIEVPMPILFGRRNLGYVFGERNSPYVWKSDPLQTAGFPTLSSARAAASAGLGWKQVVYKPSGGFQAGTWVDLWGCPGGDPVAGLYTGTAFTARQFTDADTGAIQHGGNVSPLQKHLSYFAGNDSSTGPANSVLMLYDRVLTYEGCTATGALQNMVNTLPALRYASGPPGLQISLTVQTATGATATNLTQLAYTNQAGTAAQAMPTNPTIAMFPSATGAGATPGTATILAPYWLGITQPFLPLATGDTGVRKIESYTTSATNTGTLCFVLSRPLGYLVMPIVKNQFETDTFYQVLNPARIYDGACLSLFACAGVTSNGGTISARIETILG